LNAIIGFGEIIEGQYLGPAHRAYRERATEIVRQARGLSDAVDNLDLAARLRTGRLHGEAHSALDLVRAVLENVRLELGREQVKVTIEDRGGTLRVALPPSLAERLVGQFAAAMLAPAGAGEQIGVVVDRFSGSLAIAIDRPRALRGLSEQQILADRDRAGMGFGLRLVQGLAEMTGGRLDIGADRLVLLLPLAN
jgi:signal transduction histidine kinase